MAITPFEYKNKQRTVKVMVEGLKIVTIKGPRGDSPSDQKLLSLIRPLIPDPDKGEKGDKGEDGESIIGPPGQEGESPSKKELESLIKPLLPDPIPGKPGKDGRIYTAGEIRDMLENLKNKLSIQAIEGLAKILEELSKKKEQPNEGYMKGSVHNTKSAQIKFIDDETPTNSGDDINFTIKRLPASGSLKFYRNGSRQVLTTDYTLTGKTLTLVVPLQDPSEKLLVDYRVS